MPPFSLFSRRLALFARRSLFAMLLLTASLWTVHARAQDATAVALSQVEQQTAGVKDVVLGLLSYVRWPTEPAGILLCVVGPTSYADGLMRGMMQPTGRKVLAQRRAADDAQLGEQCNAVYLGLLTDAEREALFHTLDGHAVLSISERDLACSVGSQFCLNVGSPRVSFEVNLDSVARSGLRVHPSVLQLAKRAARP